MDGPRVSTANFRGHSGAGIISKIHLENFMCHSSLDIEFGDYVNFITGQNGSGKSAILAALCVAFGCRAKGTQRATALKDFIKNGCSYAHVSVEVKNQGDDAFKPEIYGDLIRIERRILESSSTMTLKDHQGKKVCHRKDELHELVEHFNIDVENPCVIMSQDKSREFLHSGNDKEKFKFFFKATLLQQVNELLQNIRGQLDAANAMVEELESSIRPILKELNDLQVKIKNIEHVEEISQRLQQLKKKLAWSWVYDIQQQMLHQGEVLQKLKDRIPTCQARIDSQQVKLDRLEGELLEKKNQVALLMDKTSEVRSMKDKLQDELSLATKERLELEEDCKRRTNAIRKMSGHVKQLERQIHDIQQQHMKSTQAHEHEIEEQLKSLQEVVDSVNLNLERLQEEENALSEQLTIKMNAIKEINVEIEENEKKYQDVCAHINELQQQRTNKVTAFGGSRVIRLLHAIERHHKGFNIPPIGPIGAHLALVNDDIWAVAIENAVGKLLNAFIVTDHKDALLLRQCAKEANYQHLQIIIYDFSKPRLNIPYHMLPQTDHPTVLSVLRTDNPTIVNVLVDQGDAERQVLVRDYEVGKSVVFEKRIPNLKEVYTLEGYRMFCKGTVQTVLPPNKRLRTGRLCSSIEGQISGLEKDASKVQELVRNAKGKKRCVEEAWQDLQGRAQTTKKRRLNVEKDLMDLTSKKITLQDLKDSEATSVMEPNVDELSQEIMKVQEEMQEKELSLQMLREKMAVAEAKANDLKLSFETLCESVKVERDALAEAERELLLTVEDLHKATSEKAHYNNIMKDKVLHDIKVADTAYEDLQHKHQESYKKASIICPESEVEALGGCAGSTPEQLSAQVNRLNQRLQQETERYPESIDDLRLAYEKKERKIKRKQQIYKAFRDKLDACQKALDLRWSKFQRNATFLKQQLTWQFNGHLRRKGICGQIKVNYEDKTLSIEVKMPHDASNNTVRDTRGLSGGERSFSTLCFALALHEMTESPLRAMDEFDVFMDAVSRKISLDTLVDFAVTQGSQWIIITPNDISMVKPGERVKKQQMAAPRV